MKRKTDRTLRIVTAAVALLAELFPFVGRFDYMRPLGDGISLRVTVFPYYDPEWWSLSPVVLMGTLAPTILTLILLISQFFPRSQKKRYRKTSAICSALAALLTFVPLLGWEQLYSFVSFIASASLFLHTFITAGGARLIKRTEKQGE